MNDTQRWIVDWFGNRDAGAPDGMADPGHDTNYFEAGLIDSLGVLELIECAEQAFGIRFSERDFQDRRFARIGGLAEIIDEKSRSPVP